MFLNESKYGLSEVFWNIFGLVLLHMVEPFLFSVLLSQSIWTDLLTINSVLPGTMHHLLNHWILLIIQPSVIDFFWFLFSEKKIIFKHILMWIWAICRESKDCLIWIFLLCLSKALEGSSNLSENLVDVKGLIHEQ